MITMLRVWHGAGAQVGEVALLVEGDLLALGYAVDEEHLVSLFMDSLESLSSGNAVMPIVSEALSERTLQYIMGHSDISVTLNVYTHVQFDDAQAELLRVAEA